MRDPRWVARRIEAKHPELGTGLLAAVEQRSAVAVAAGWASCRRPSSARRSNTAATHDWDETVPTLAAPRREAGPRRGAWRLARRCPIVLVAGPVALAGQRRDGRVALAADAADVQVEPGDTELERGTSLLVVARFNGARSRRGEPRRRGRAHRGRAAAA